MKPLLHQTFLPNKGQASNVPEEFLLDEFSPESRNLEFFQELLQGRGGLKKFDEFAIGRIQNQFLYKKFDGTFYHISFTMKDILVFVPGATPKFDYINPTYTTGTVTILVGTPTIVTGSGTSWLANLKAGDYIKTGAGNINTLATWYQILTVDSDTQLTLTSAAAAVAGSAYVARITFTGTEADIWDVERFVDDGEGEVVVATNNSDTPIFWTGTGQVEEVTNLPSNFTAKYVDVYKDRLHFLWTVEGGGNQPQRQRWSAVADLTDWPATNFRDYVDESTEITGSCRFQGYHIVFKEAEAYVGRHVGGTFIFDYVKSSTAEGCRSNHSIVARKDWIHYYGRDKKFHRWNLARDQIISEGIFRDSREFDPILENFIFGREVVSKDQIRWFCPHSGSEFNDYCFVWNFVKDIPMVWKYEKEQALSCIGEYVNDEDLYVDDPVWGEFFVDEQIGFWDDSGFLSDAKQILYGGYDGILRIADSGADDDGEEFTRKFESKRQNFEHVDRLKRLWTQQHWFEADVAGTVTVSLQMDDKVNREVGSKTVSLVDPLKDTIKADITWDKYAQNFKTIYEATNHFAMIGYISRYFLKKSVA